MHRDESTRLASGQGVLDGFKALNEVIGREEILKANQTLMKYKEGKTNLEQRIVENEKWYKVRHWECMRAKSDEIQPSSAWLFNCIANKHSDAMDNIPAPTVLPREAGDKAEAKMLSSILPVILEQNDFEETYSSVMNYKLKMGTGVYGVFWAGDKLNGLGDIQISKIDLLCLFWEPGVTDIQKSRNIFHVELVDNDLLEQVYPKLANKLGGKSFDVTKYAFDDTVDTSHKSLVVDWYYKKNVGGKTVLHYCKYVNNEVLFATENEPTYAERGWYDHGEYPFVFDPLFPTEGSPTGFGYIDVGKDVQSYIDQGNQAILKNMLANAKPRHFIKTDGSVNEEEYADLTKDFIHVDGTLGADSIVPVQGKPLNDIYVKVIQDKIEELKETTGNRDVSQGGTTGGVTAASAIAAQIEAGSKLSRTSNKAAYRAFRKVCVLCIELIRQFYDMPRKFRILGENGAAEYVTYTNQAIQMSPTVSEFGVEVGGEMPLFDISVSAQKQSPYSRLSQNELALQFYTTGFFNPQMSDQALAALEMMDFDRKDFIMERIAQNGTMYQQIVMLQQELLKMAQLVDSGRGTNFAEQIAAGVTGGGMVAPRMGGIAKAEMLGGETEEPTITKNARKRVAESTSPT